ncbi:MAG: DUF2203 domain-containing protein [Bryobacteraceae bacterium]|jgi:hypothetical protein
MPRFFSLQQAQKLLPEVESAIRDAISLKAEFQRAEAEWQGFAHRVAIQGGLRADRSQLLEQKRHRESTARDLKQAIERIHQAGCLVKDLDIGLIDFPTLLHGEEVYLCWKLGETGIRFWHGIHEGFGGRKEIDQEFLEHHQGELPN